MPSRSMRKAAPLLGSGNKGYIYRIESDVLYTALVTAPSTQITAFQTGADGALYAATGNVGKIYRLGPGLAQEGSLESEVFDAGFFSHWGRLSFEAQSERRRHRDRRAQRKPRPAAEELEPLVGGHHRPQGRSPRRARGALHSMEGDARRPRGAQSPELESVDVAYLQRNVAPRIEAIESTPANYKFPAPSIPLAPSQTLTLPPIGKPRPVPDRPVARFRHALHAVRQGLRRARAGPPRTIMATA